MTINAINIIPCKTDGCPTMGDYAIAKKMNVKWGSHKVGDIVLFDFNGNGTSDHIGIVVNVGSNYIETVEGNTSSDNKGSQDNGGGVFRRRRYKSGVNYFVRPKYNDEITAQMVVQTALAEVGTVEKPKNSNKVKYNQWFYGKNASAYWCCTFVCWVFAHVKGEVKPIPKPTGKYAGLIPEGLIKIGAKGDKVLQLQKFLNWYGADCGKADGEFGENTFNGVCVFQKTEGLKVDGEFGANSYAKAITYKEKVKEYYNGEFPVLLSKHRFGHCANRKIDCVEIDFKYTSSGAKHWTYVAVWKDKSKGKKAAAFVKNCIKRSPKIQYSDKPNLKKKLIANKGKMPSGDLTANCSNLMAAAVYYAAGKEIADKGAKNQLAQLRATGLFNIYTDGKQKKPTSDGAIYGCSKHTGMGIEYAPYLCEGDEGSEVTKLQKFLNWAGYDCGTADGDFGEKTKGAVKSFQYDNGLTSDGEFGSKSLVKAKEYKRG